MHEFVEYNFKDKGYFTLRHLLACDASSVFVRETYVNFLAKVRSVCTDQSIPKGARAMHQQYYTLINWVLGQCGKYRVSQKVPLFDLT